MKEAAARASLGFPWTEEQAAGAWIGLAGLVLWGARHQWKTVSKQVPADEHRAAVRLSVGAVICAALCAVVMAAIGIPSAAAVGIILVYVAYVIAGARIRAEAGGQWTFAPVTATAQRVTYSVLGTPGTAEGALAPSGYLSLMLVDIRAQSLPYLTEGLDIAERSGIKWRTVLTWDGIGTVTALSIGWWASLTKYYANGAATAKVGSHSIVKANIAFQEVERMVSASRSPSLSSSLAIARRASLERKQNGGLDAEVDRMSGAHSSCL